MSDAAVHEVLRVTRGLETRIYNLLPVPDGAELWRVTETAGAPSRSVKETHFRDAEAAVEFLEEVRRTLKAGGWQEEWRFASYETGAAVTTTSEAGGARRNHRARRDRVLVDKSLFIYRLWHH